MPKTTKKTSKTRFRPKPLDWFCIIVGVIISILTVLVDHNRSLIYIIFSILMLNFGIMWGPIGSLAVVALRVFFVLSSIYGYINWCKFIKKAKN